ncbi:MAG: SsrA-binding protein SmpB [bacterium]|nr:SsrA-binding protein SmpB [bacterium]
MSDLSKNQKAYFNYFIIETIEAGLELKGFEVKAIKSGRANIGGSFATIKDGQLWLTNANIRPYQPKNTPVDYDSKRPRRLLIKRSEINSLIAKLNGERLTIVPLRLYNKGSLIKVELGLVRGKKKSDKRETIKKRAIEREAGRTFKN